MSEEITTSKNRRKLRLKVIEERIKKVRSLEQELDRINDELWNLGYTILEKPLRDGWYRTMVLRHDIAKHKKAHVYQEILNAVNIKFWGREKKYADRAMMRYFRNRNRLYYRNDIRYLDKKAYMSLSSAAKKYFFKAKIKINFRHLSVYISTLPKYYFVSTYERAYITKRKIIAPKLESRIQEIENELLSSKFYALSNYNGYSYKLYHEPNRKRRRRTNVALRSFDIEYLESMTDSEIWE